MTRIQEKLYRPDSLLVPGKFHGWARFHMELYRMKNVPRWAAEIERHVDSLHQQIIDPANEPVIRAREAAFLFPVIMPGARLQQEELILGMERLQPLWKEDGVIMEVTGFRFDRDVMQNIKEHTEFWSHIPDNPYICWLPATQGVPEWTLGEPLLKLKNVLEHKHRTEPMLCGAWEASPLEHAAMNCVYTHLVKLMMPERATIRPRGSHAQETCFISFGGTQFGEILNSWFYTPRGESTTNYIDNCTYSGFRPAVRWLYPMS